jgi:hypothetical protein
MLPLLDPQLRLVLLHHLALSLARAGPEQVGAAGLTPEQLARLRQLPAVDLARLAAMAGLTIGIALDGAALQTGLRSLVMLDEARALETYFIRHGASARLMSRLFRLPRKRTLQLRRDLGVLRPSGRVRLPDHDTRERIFLAWHALEEPVPRLRYHQLHQAFPQFPIAVLEVIVRANEVAA